jgi:hypothetical protein
MILTDMNFSYLLTKVNELVDVRLRLLNVEVFGQAIYGPNFIRGLGASVQLFRTGLGNVDVKGAGLDKVGLGHICDKKVSIYGNQFGFSEKFSSGCGWNVGE